MGEQGMYSQEDQLARKCRGNSKLLYHFIADRLSVQRIRPAKNNKRNDNDKDTEGTRKGYKARNKKWEEVEIKNQQGQLFLAVGLMHG
jgi:hypothetical protein